MPKEDIKNYTSGIPVEQSIMRIEKALVRAGATHIAKTYEDGETSGILFQLKVKEQFITFKLPAKAEAVIEVFAKSVKRPRKDTMKNIRNQANRTAWKILHDWVEIQCTMVLLEQAENIEVFLPYVYDMNKEQTLFEKMKTTNYKALLT